MALLNRGLEEGLTEKELFELKENEPCVGRILQAEKSKYKGSEAGTWLVCLRNSQEATVAGVE